MRSDIVFDALQNKNRFALCHEAFKAVRLLHKNNTRIEDTTNNALQRLAGAHGNEGLGNPEDLTESLRVALEPSTPIVADDLPIA
jgi:hypothetical protein